MEEIPWGFESPPRHHEIKGLRQLAATLFLWPIRSSRRSSRNALPLSIPRGVYLSKTIGSIFLPFSLTVFCSACVYGIWNAFCNHCQIIGRQCCHDNLFLLRKTDFQRGVNRPEIENGPVWGGLLVANDNGCRPGGYTLQYPIPRQRILTIQTSVR